MTEHSNRFEQLKLALSALDDLGLDRASAAAGPALEFLLRESQEFQLASQTSESIVRGDDQNEEGLDPVARAVEWAGVSAQAIQDIVEFGPEGVKPTIYHGKLPKEKAQRQRAISLLKLGLDKVAYGNSEVPARQVNDVCSTYECLDQNLPTNLQRSGLATRRGSRGSYHYRLTLQGDDRARELIRTLAGLTEGKASKRKAEA